MKGKCPNCGAAYQIDDSIIPDKGAYARCPKCQTRFFLTKQIELQEGGPHVQKEESHMRICPKCGYQRQPKDDEFSPANECPKCGAVYEKAQEKLRVMIADAKKNKTISQQKGTENIASQLQQLVKLYQSATVKFVVSQLQQHKTFVVFSGIVIVGMLGLMLWGWTLDRRLHGPVSKHLTTSSRNRSKSEQVKSIPQIAQDVKSLSIHQIMDYSMVKDAAITQQGDEIDLAIIANYATSKSRAIKLGDNFVRLVKSLSKDTPPGKEIGKGIYSYSIGVFYPDKKRIVIGAKNKYATRISWW
jgi:predicted Zn finger-like uncharacterized protein